MILGLIWLCGPKKQKHFSPFCLVSNPENLDNLNKMEINHILIRFKLQSGFNSFSELTERYRLTQQGFSILIN